MSKTDIYYKELRECLEKRSVDELMSFIERWVKRGVLSRKLSLRHHVILLIGNAQRRKNTRKKSKRNEIVIVEGEEDDGSKLCLI